MFKQVHGDGVDFEASTAYHRLVLELFLFPALFRKARKLDVDPAYGAHLVKMAAFVRAYSRTDGSSPWWGDADDGRVLPFGGQAMDDHRYLVAVVARTWETDFLAEDCAEVFWTHGAITANARGSAISADSRSFPDAGCFVMRAGGHHVFIDCGPVGLAGRGGHGHNDCLSFEAALDGVTLLADRGSYVYSASPTWRNRFRGTAYHNTPLIDDAEQNRFVKPDYLWTLHSDARPVVARWETSTERDLFVGSHEGYRRLAEPVTPIRTIMLDKTAGRLAIFDRFDGRGLHEISIPFHLAPEVEAEPLEGDVWRLTARGRAFLFVARGDGWAGELEDSWSSPSYGVKVPAKVLRLTRSGELTTLAVAVMPTVEGYIQAADGLFEAVMNHHV